MKSLSKEQQLFQSLRQSPTELDLAEVESIIGGLPNASPLPSAKNNWNNFFHFKTLLLMTISIAILLGFFVFINPETPLAPPSPVSNKLPSISEVRRETPRIEIETVTPAVTPSAPLNTPSQNLPIPEKMPAPKSEPALLSTTQEAIPTTPLTPEVAPSTTATDPVKEIAAPTFENKDSARPGTNIPLSPPQVIASPVPELSGSELRRLKRTLLKELVKDGLLQSKRDVVVMELPGDRIVLNGAVLDAALFLKYQGLTHKVGQGPDRKIKMESAYIQVGDFGPEGFSGSGSGTFTIEMQSEQDDLWKKEEEGIGLFSNSVELQQAALDLFAKQIVGDRKRSGKMVGVNINGEKTEALYKALYERLVKDQLLKSKKDLVVLELPKGQILVNGVALNADLYTVYRRLLDQYKVGQGPLRQIRMNEYLLEVGDYKYGNFKGTISLFED